jgi:hypothetical protein
VVETEGAGEAGGGLYPPSLLPLGIALRNYRGSSLATNAALRAAVAEYARAARQRGQSFDSVLSTVKRTVYDSFFSSPRDLVPDGQGFTLVDHIVRWCGDAYDRVD